MPSGPPPTEVVESAFAGAPAHSVALSQARVVADVMQPAVAGHSDG